MVSFKWICEKFDGKIVNGKCKIGKFTMAKADYLFDYKPESQQFKVMTPTEFLWVVPPEPFNNKEVRRKLKRKIRNGVPIDPLFLDVNVDNCQVIRHEGRNRAIVSRELGIKKLPVIIYNKKEWVVNNPYPSVEEEYTKKKNKCKKLIEQEY